jgi:tRNA (mo5U34)-methyltransferase
MQPNRTLSADEITALKTRIEEVGPWFHNFQIAPGVWTDATGYGPGSAYLEDRWSVVETLLPPIEGRSCLDVGCCSGFFSFQLKEAGAADVLGVDQGDQPKAIAQARVAETYLRKGVRFEATSIYDLAALDRQFDVVICLGVLYHLRHPLLAIEALRSVSREGLVLQTITTATGPDFEELPPDTLEGLRLRSELLADPRFPHVRFVESKLDNDGSCWSVPSPQAVFAMLRASGFRIGRYVARPHEIYVHAIPA